jgi:hypothetical protein
MVGIGWVPPPLQVVNHGRRIQIGAVVERDARPQGEGPGQAARRHLPAFGQAGNGERVLRSVLDQRLIDLTCHQKRNRIRFQSRIQAWWILLHSTGERVAARDGLGIIETIWHDRIHRSLCWTMPQALLDTSVGRHRCVQQEQHSGTESTCEQDRDNRLCHPPSKS